MSEEDKYVRRQKKKAQAKMLKPFIALVPEVGIEPTRAQGPEDFESSASTSFTTPASGCNYSEIAYLVNIITLNLSVKRYLSSSHLFKSTETGWKKSSCTMSAFHLRKPNVKNRFS